MFRMYAVTVFFFLASVSAFGQNYFWSTSGFGEGAVNDDFKVGASIGDSGRAYLYYDAEGVQNVTEGFDFDFAWDISGVTAFTAAETLDFDISIASTPVSDRWGDFAGPAESVTADEITGFLTVNVVNGTGIQVANIPPGFPFIDEGYDWTADAFLVGTVDWAAIGAGSASIEVTGALVVDSGQSIEVPFSGFTVNVVPEPATGTIVMFCLMGLSFRRRRQCQQ